MAYFQWWAWVTFLGIFAIILRWLEVRKRPWHIDWPKALGFYALFLGTGWFVITVSALLNTYL